MILLSLRNGGTITVVGATRVEIRETVLFCLDDRSRIVASLQSGDVRTYKVSPDVLDDQLEGNLRPNANN